MANDNSELDVKNSADSELEDIRKIIAANILTYRGNLSLSRADLAAKVGVTEAAIGQYERGERIPSIAVLKKIAVVFGFPVDSLIGQDVSEYDAVKDYQFELACKIMEKNGFSLLEGSEGEIVLYLPEKEPPPVFAVKDNDGKFSIKKRTPEQKLGIIAFDGRESFITFFGILIEKFMTAYGARKILLNSLIGLKEKGYIEVIMSISDTPF